MWTPHATTDTHRTTPAMQLRASTTCSSKPVFFRSHPEHYSAVARRGAWASGFHRSADARRARPRRSRVCDAESGTGLPGKHDRRRVFDPVACLHAAGGVGRRGSDLQSGTAELAVTMVTPRRRVACVEPPFWNSAACRPSRASGSDRRVPGRLDRAVRRGLHVRGEADDRRAVASEVYRPRDSVGTQGAADRADCAVAGGNTGDRATRSM